MILSRMNTQQIALGDVIQKSRKSQEDVQFIYERIRTFRFFENFFAQNLRTIEHEDVLALCRRLQYEKHSMADFIFKYGDESNNKFYVIISGEVSVITPKKDCMSPNAIDESPTYKRTKSKKTFSFDPEEMDALSSDGDFKDEQVWREHIGNFGTFVRSLGEGEGFGDLALKNDEQRSASIICRTDCELLIITKEKFDLMFLKEEHEKEAFLKEVFPFINTTIASKNKFNNLYCSFKTEAYNKGAYLTLDGQPTDEGSRFYIIYQGECVVEKNLSIEVSSPYDRGQPVARNTRCFQISKIGRGVVVGEEILLNEPEYIYTVKVISEVLIVHSISKKEFESRLFKEFRDYVIQLYIQKSKHRKTIFDSSRRDSEAKAEQFRSENTFSIKNSAIKNLTTKPAVQGLSRYMQREQQFLDQKDFPGTITARASNFGLESASLPFKLSDEKRFLEEWANQNSKGSKEMLRSAKMSTLYSTKNKKIISRLDLLNKIPDSEDNTFIPKDIDEIKLFDNNTRRKLKHDPKKRLTEVQSSYQNSPLAEQRIDYDFSSPILKELAKDAKKYRLPIQAPLIATDQFLPDEKRFSLNQDKIQSALLAKSTNYSDKKPFPAKHSPSLKLKTCPEVLECKPITNSPSTFFTENTISKVSVIDQNSPYKKNSLLADSIPSIAITSPLPKLKIGNINEMEDGVLMIRTGRCNSIRAGRKESELSGGVLYTERITTKQSSSPVRLSQNSAQRNQINSSTSKGDYTIRESVSHRLHGQQATNNSQTLNARDWRKKVFKKVMTKLDLSKRQLDGLDVGTSLLSNRMLVPQSTRMGKIGGE